MNAATLVLRAVLAADQPMSHEQMMDVMDMDDTAAFGKVLFDQLEWRDGGAFAWDATAWYGGDYDKLVVRTQGERADGHTEEARVEAMWNRAVSPWWNVQIGARHDFGAGPSREWASFGVQGLTPYWFDLEATFYVGEQGRTAARLKAEYELLLTQRLILQPEAELNWYGKDDDARGVGAGVSDAELGVRLRYEIRREIAPYVGVVWAHRFGERGDASVVAGVRIWF